MTAGRTAVVTGASAGIGAATARLLAADGWEVVVGARRVGRIEALAEEIGARAHALDDTDQASVDAFCASIDACSLLVNNAGGALGVEPLVDAVDEKWQTMFETNVLGLMRMTRALLPRLIDSGDGHVVNVTSIAGHYIHPFAGSAYSISKTALSGLTREMANEFAELDIRVNAVAPGEIETEMVGPEYDLLIPRIPLQRMGTPADVAGTIFYLCSDDSRYVTGTEVWVTGGQHLF